MLIKAEIFRIICGLWASFIIILVSSPLATLAFRSPQTVEKQVDTPPTAYTVPSSAHYINENADNLYPTDKPLYDLLTVAERQSKNLPTIVPVVQPYYNEKVVYLTFDDGPDPDNTPIILDILSNHGIKATFFVVGTQIEKYPDILKRTSFEGHAIGNHTYDHIYRNLYQSETAYIKQLYQTDDLIKNILGFRPRISRAPGGSAGHFTKKYWDLLKNDGYIEVGWNVSSGDASRAKASQIVSNILHQMEQNFLWNHTIVLMHDGRGHNETVLALPEIIKFYKEQGFEFRVINAETPPAW